MNINVRLDEADHRRVVDRLIEIQSAGRDLSPAMRSIARILERETHDSFAGERAPDGTPWAPLQPATLRQRERIGADGPILQVHRMLLRSIQRDAGRDHAAVGTNLVYAATHQFGREFGRGNPIPARPFLGFTPDTTRELVDAVRRHLAG